jgi:hypothetical protein
MTALLLLVGALAIVIVVSVGLHMRRDLEAEFKREKANAFAVTPNNTTPIVTEGTSRCCLCRATLPPGQRLRRQAAPGSRSSGIRCRHAAQAWGRGHAGCGRAT